MTALIHEPTPAEVRAKREATAIERQITRAAATVHQDALWSGIFPAVRREDAELYRPLAWELVFALGDEHWESSGADPNQRLAWPGSLTPSP